MALAFSPNPLQSNGQVHGLVNELDERGNQHLKVRPRGVLVRRARRGIGVVPGAKQTQRPRVTVEDVGGVEASIKTVALEARDPVHGRVALLVQARVSPRRPTPPTPRCSWPCSPHRGRRSASTCRGTSEPRKHKAARVTADGPCIMAALTVLSSPLALIMPSRFIGSRITSPRRSNATTAFMTGPNKS